MHHTKLLTALTDVTNKVLAFCNAVNLGLGYNALNHCTRQCIIY